ncbi:MAG TPA: NHL repeat-containing protein [Oscillatoriaceae cyanobacterium]
MKKHVGIVIGALLSACTILGCQGIPFLGNQPTRSIVKYGSMNLDGDASLAISLDVRPLLEQRTVLAAEGPIIKLVVTITGKNTDFRDQQEVMIADCTQGNATAEFFNLPEDQYTVAVVALNAAGEAVKSATQSDVQVSNDHITEVPLTCKPASGTLKIDWSCDDSCGVSPSPSSSPPPMPSSPTPSPSPVVTHPFDIAVDAVGNLWVSDRLENLISEYSSSGALLGNYPSGGKLPSQLTFDPSGNLWSSNQGDGTVTEYLPSGVIAKTIPVGKEPREIAFDSAGNFWVGLYDSNELEEFSASGSLLKTVSLSLPEGVVVDTSGDVWVSEAAGTTGQAIAQISPTGSILKQIPLGAWVTDITFDSSGNLWAALQTKGGVDKISPTGAILGTYTTGGSTPQFLTIDPSGNVWATNTGSNNVSEMSPSGSLLNKFTVGKTPYGLAVGKDGTIWVCNYNGPSPLSSIHP